MFEILLFIFAGIGLAVTVLMLWTFITIKKGIDFAEDTFSNFLNEEEH